jgi:hypothetical protein
LVTPSRKKNGIPQVSAPRRMESLKSQRPFICTPRRMESLKSQRPFIEEWNPSKVSAPLFVLSQLNKGISLENAAGKIINKY